MKPTDTMDLTVKMPVADVLNTLAPHIDTLVNHKVALIRQHQDGPTRRMLTALDLSINNLVRATTQLEKSEHTRAEGAATDTVIAAAKSLKKAFNAYKRGH